MRALGARYVVRLCAAVLAVGALCVASPAVAEVDRFASYPGPEYDAGLLRLTPTAAKPQNKLWWHDGRWWALMLDSADRTVRIASLQPDHSWAMTGPVVSREPVSVGDVVADGRQLHVLSRTALGVAVTTYRFDRGTREYGRIPGSAATVTPRGTSSAALAKDALGRLWVTYVTDRVWVVHSGPSGTTWTLPFQLPVPRVTIGDGEISDIVAFDDRIGVMWSDQRRGAVRFAVHRDSDPDTQWSTEAALRGPGSADDHINLHVVTRDGTASPLAVVKTSLGDQGEPGTSPLVVLLRREADGSWTQHPVATVADGWTRPVLSTDTGGTAYVVGRRAGSIVLKSADLDTLDFEGGTGQVVLGDPTGSLTDPTVASQVTDPLCGIVVLASDERSQAYVHGELALSGSAEDAGTACPPGRADIARPTSVSATVSSGVVRLSWSPGSTPWTPAGSPPVGRSFTVLRDGRKVGSTSQVTFVDDPPAGTAARYQVVAVDGSGSSLPSRPRRVMVPAATAGLDLPVPSRTLVIALAVLVVGGGLLVLLRTLAVRRGPRPVRETAEAGGALALPVLPPPKGKHARPSDGPGPPSRQQVLSGRPAGRHRPKTDGDSG